MKQTPTLHKALSMLLTAAMVFNIGLTPVFAAEGVTPPGVSGVCTHHTEHTEDCGYQQGTPCTHAHTDDCYTQELTCVLIEGDVSEITTDSDADIDSDAVVDSGNVSADAPHDHGEDCYAITENCKHTHDDTCGYTPDSPCRFDVASCTQCDTGDKPVEKVCTCEPVDSGELVHGENCPLYTAPVISDVAENTITVFAHLEQSEYTLPIGADRETTANVLVFPETVKATVNEVKTDLAVTWVSNKELSTETADTFTYTAKLSDEGYTLAKGLSLPKITVTIGEGTIIRMSTAEDTIGQNGAGNQWLEVSSAENSYRTINYIAADGKTYETLVYSSTESSAVLIGTALCGLVNGVAQPYEPQVLECQQKGGRFPKIAEYKILIDSKAYTPNPSENLRCQGYDAIWFNKNGSIGSQELGRNPNLTAIYFTAFDIHRNPISPTEAFVSQKIYDASAFTVAMDNFTWLGVETPTITYYVDENGTKTTPENSGAADEGAAPVNVGDYFIKLSTEAVVVDGVTYEPSNSDYIPIGILDGVPVKITAQPEPTSAVYGYSAGTAPVLSLTAAPTGSASEVTYQWYSVGTGAGNTDEKISGATQASYTVPVGLDVGAYSYYCAASCIGYPVRSDTATVTITTANSALELSTNKSDNTFT